MGVVRSRRVSVTGGAAALVFVIAALSAHAIQTREANDLVSLLVWDPDGSIDSSALPRDLSDEIARLQQRARAYRSPPSANIPAIPGTNTCQCSPRIAGCVGYDYEKRPADAAQSRRAYLDAVSTARRARSPLIRAAAVELARRDSCF